MDNALKVKILDVLEHHNVMTLATIRPDGFPQATTVNYVHDDLILFFARMRRRRRPATSGLTIKSLSQSLVRRKIFTSCAAYRCRASPHASWTSERRTDDLSSYFASCRSHGA